MKPFAPEWCGVAPIAAAVLVAACASGPETAAYVETLGTDTMSVETFTRSADRIEGTLITRSPLTRVARYQADIGPDGDITRLNVAYSTPTENPDAPEPLTVTVTPTGDSATVERVRDGADTLRIAIPAGTMPVVGRTPLPMGFVDYFSRRAASAASDSFGFSYLPAGRQRVGSNAIVRRSADSVSLDFFGSPMMMRVDGNGHVLGVDGHGTTRKVDILMVDPAAVDLDALAADFAGRDARGEGIGVASPEVQIQASGGGASFEIDYSRPAKRGREIFGGLVPFDEVWRTGANAATLFTTSRNLMIGDERVPAGSYTLWTRFTATSATLIINSETGQWGTAYDAAQDFVQVPLDRVALSEPIERFTIAIDPTDDGGVLKLSWDRSEFSVPMRVVR